MRHALGRILWIVPSLALVSAIAFFVLAQAAASPASLDADVTTERRLRSLPLFFNPAPADVRILSLQAVAGLATSDGAEARHAATLARLGGAALPHVLPILETLRPDGRARVALALLPVARRMRLIREDTAPDADEAILFWQRFWEDHALDFRPAVARRAVRRAALEASTARRDEIRELDTYALAELMAALGPVRTRADADRAARLSLLLEPLSRACSRIPADASVPQAAARVMRCRRWWAATGSEYVALDGPAKVTAMVGDTRYGKWLDEAVRFGLGLTYRGTPVLTELVRHGRWTLILVAAGLLGGYFGGGVVGLLAGARPGRTLDRLLCPLALIAAAVPPAALAAWLSAPEVPLPRASAAIAVMVLPGFALASRHQRALMRHALREEPARTLLAFGAGPLALARAHLRDTSAAMLSLLGSDLPLLLTAAFVVERAAGLAGLGEFTLEAIERRDLAWLMALALLGTLTVGLAQIVSDALLSRLDWRLHTSFALRAEGSE